MLVSQWQSLPFDILDCVAFFIRDDEVSLIAFGQTCRAWRATLYPGKNSNTRLKLELITTRHTRTYSTSSTSSSTSTIRNTPESVKHTQLRTQSLPVPPRVPLLSPELDKPLPSVPSESPNNASSFPTQHTCPVRQRKYFLHTLSKLDRLSGLTVGAFERSMGKMEVAFAHGERAKGVWEARRAAAQVTADEVKTKKQEIFGNGNKFLTVEKGRELGRKVGEVAFGVTEKTILATQRYSIAPAEREWYNKRQDSMTDVLPRPFLSPTSPEFPEHDHLPQDHDLLLDETRSTMSLQSEAPTYHTADPLFELSTPPRSVMMLPQIDQNEASIRYRPFDPLAGSSTSCTRRPPVPSRRDTVDSITSEATFATASTTPTNVLRKSRKDTAQASEDISDPGIRAYGPVRLAVQSETQAQRRTLKKMRNPRHSTT